jgi:putative oxidoreductase
MSSRPIPALKLLLIDLGLLLLRAIVGVVFVYHGSQKFFGAFDGPGIAGFADVLGQMGITWPRVGATLSAATEFCGGLAMLLGLATRLAAIPMVFNMIVAVVMVHRHAFSLENGGMEYALTLAVVLAALGLCGPGRLSADHLILPWLRLRRAARGVS